MNTISTAWEFLFLYSYYKLMYLFVHVYMYMCVFAHVCVCVCDFVLGAVCSHCDPVNFQTLRNRDLHQVSFLSLINQLVRFMKCLIMPLMLMP